MGYTAHSNGLLAANRMLVTQVSRPRVPPVTLATAPLP